MSRRTWVIVIIAAFLAVVGLVALRTLSTQPSSRLELSGDVENDVRTVDAPRLTRPAPDVAVGIPSPQTNPLAGARKASPAAGASMQTTISGVIEQVYVQQGDHVEAGQVVAQLDTTMLDLGVAQAETSAARSRSQVKVLDANLGTLADNQAKLSDARAQLATAQRQLDEARQKAAAGKAQVQAGIKQIQAVINGPHPPGPWPPPPLAQQLAKLKALLAKIIAGEKQLAAAQAKLDAGRAKLASGASALSTAKTQLRNAKDVLGIVADSQTLAVDLAKYRRDQATLMAPVSGTVTEVRQAGTVAMVGAPVVRIRADRATQIDTFVTGAQLALVPIGTPALVDYDSNRGAPLSGHVTYVGERATFPPTGFPTDIVHMTRAVKVTIALDNDGWAPPGTPVDIVIDSKRNR